VKRRIRVSTRQNTRGGNRKGRTEPANIVQREEVAGVQSGPGGQCRRVSPVEVSPTGPETSATVMVAWAIPDSATISAKMIVDFFMSKFSSGSKSVLSRYTLNNTHGQGLPYWSRIAVVGTSRIARRAG